MAERLLASLEPGDEVERAWMDEIQRRSDEITAGTANLIPAEQAFAPVRARLN